MEFNFDAWAKLAKDDPAEFERRRELTLRAAIDAAPPAFRQRLEGLQFRLNMERERAATPLASCVRINTLMWAGFYRLRKQLLAASGSAPRPHTDPKQSAEVIPLRGSRQRQRKGSGTAS